MKRLNWKLVIGLIVGTFVTAGAAFGVHRLQIRGTAEDLLAEGQRLHTEASEMAKSKDKKKEAYLQMEKAAEMLAFHLQMKPDNMEAADEQALIWNEMIKLSSDTTELRRSLEAAIYTSEQAINLFPDGDHKQVRRNVANLYISPYQRYEDAAKHLNALLEHDKDNTELKLLLARCYAQSPRQEQKAARALEEITKNDPHQIDAYLLLASVHRDRLSEDEKSDLVIDEMVKANPDAFRAYLARAGFNIANPEKKEQVLSDVKEAMRLAPQDVDVMTTAISILIREEEPDQAEIETLRTNVLAALDKDPNDERLYRAIWQVSHMQRKPEEAQMWLEKGAKKFPDSQSMMVMLADQFFSTNKKEELAKKVAELKKLPNARVDIQKYLQARLDMANRKWEDAVAGLIEARAMMPQSAQSIDLDLGELYLLLDRPNDAQAVYERVLVTDRSNVTARAGKAYCTYRQGESQKAVTLLDELLTDMGEEKFAANPKVMRTYSQVMGDYIRSLPAERQPEEWKKLNQLAGKAGGSGGGEGSTMQAALTQIQLLIQQQKLAEAKQLTSKILEQNPKQATLWAYMVQITALEPQGEEKALKLLRSKSAELGRPLPLRKLEIGLASAGPDKQKGAAELVELAKGIDELPDAEQEVLYRDLGAAYQRLGNMPEAISYMRKARKAQPSDSSILRQMWLMARTANDDAMMQEVIKDYIDRFKKDSEEVLAVEAGRIIALVDAKKLDNDQLVEAKKKLEQLEKKNSRSGPLARLTGDIARIEGDNQKAIDEMRKAVERGERDPVMIATLAHLLTIRGQQAEADQMLDRLKNAGYDDYPDRVRKMEMALKGNYGPLIEILEQFLERDSSDIAKWLDLVSVLRMAKQQNEAETRLREIVKRFPEDERGWVALVGQLVDMNRRADAESTLETAKKTVAADKRLAVSAMAREKLGPVDQTAKEYELWLAASPSDLRAHRAAAAFQLAQVQADRVNSDAHLAEAIKYLDKMIAQAASAPEADQQFVAWARTTKAQTLASTTKHKDFQTAVKLLDDNVAAKQDTSTDEVLRATMYAARPEKVYRREGVRLLQQLRQQDLLNPFGQLGLAQLLNELGEWEQARSVLAGLVNAEGMNDPRYAAVMVKLLVDHKEANQSSNYLESLTKYHPTDPLTKASQARVLIAQGKADDGVKLLKALIPRPLPSNQAVMLYQVAKLLDELGQTDAADQLYGEFYAASPASILTYADFRARHGRTDAALELCDSAMAKGFPAERVVPVGNLALRNAKPAATPAQYARVDKWIDLGLASNNSNAVTLKLMRAELLDQQARYDDVEKIYRGIVDDKTISDRQRALVGNNLGYLLAMRGETGKTLDDALQMVNDAIDIFGPSSDLLDTRAMVHLAKKNATAAMTDLDDAIAEEPSGGKFFHLALAQMDAGDAEKARASFQRARDDYAFDAAGLSTLERKQYDRLKTGLGL